MTTTSTNVFWSATLSVIILFSGIAFGQKSVSDGMVSKNRNFSTFSENQKQNLDAWRSLNQERFYNHPDFGFLPDNAPCTDCVEDLSKREKDLRHYVDINDPSRFFIQRGSGLLHFKENGFWKTINYKLKPTSSQDVFESEFYLNDVRFNRLTQKTEIITNSGSLELNQWSLLKVVNGEEQFLSEADWSDYTIGEDGMYIKNIFSGIDAELIIYPGGIKTSFIIKKAEYGQYDAILFRDNMVLSSGNELDISLKSDNSKQGSGGLSVSSNNVELAEFGDALAYTESRNKASLKVMEYQINNNNVDVIVPAEWIEKFKNESSLIIDPLVTGTNTLAQAAIIGSEYNLSCGFDNSCDQFLTVPAPANATFDDILGSFTYEAINGAWLNEGAVRFETGGCVNPAAPGFYWFCNNPNPGTCALTNVSLFSDLQGCLPAPSCSPQNVDFTMQFFRGCWGTTGCNNLFIGAFTPWTMTISGQTIDYTNITNPITVSSNTVCEGGSINVSTVAQDGVPAYTYNWSFDPSGTPSVGTGANTSITFPNSGNVTLYSIVTDNCGQVSTSSEAITVFTNPTPTITGDTDYCQGQTASISTGAFSSYTWSNGASAQNTTVTDADNPITVTVTDANGCTGTSAAYSVTENPSPTPTITGSSTYCTGQTAAISAQAGFSDYSWSTGATTQNTNVTDADNPITVTVIDANGCSATSATFSVSEQTNITYSETVEICQGQSATIHGNTETVAGTYAETFMTPTCDSIATITLVVNALPTIAASASIGTLCEGESTDLSATGGDTYSWDNSLGAGAAHTVNPTTNTTYTVTGTDANGCENTDDVTITVNPPPTVNAGSNLTICTGDDATLNGSGTATTYTWDNGATDGISFTPPAGTTTYTLTGTDANGCENTDQIDVTVNPVPTVNAGIDTTICEGGSITLSGSGTATTYTWDNGVSDGVSFTPSAGTTTYTVTGIDANGCSATDAIDVTATPQPDADFTATPMSGSPPLEVDFNNQSNNGTAYDWDFGNGSTISNPSNTDESMIYTETGTYEVILSVTNGNCFDQASLFIVVEESPLSFVIPNVFTPNNDGENDLFHMNISNALEVKIEIFNRWGNLVGQITSLDPLNGWDGTNLSGNPVPDGVYFYTYKIIDLQDEELTGHQYIHLER